MTRQALRILVIVQGVTPSTVISVHRPFRYLQERGDIQWNLRLENHVSVDEIHWSDVVVFHRNCRRYALHLLNTAKRLNKPIVYDIDDDYLAADASNPLHLYLRHPKVQDTVIQFYTQADVVKAGSSHLCDRIRRYTSKVVVHPFAAPIDDPRPVRRPPRHAVTVGYAATPFHNPDLAIVVPALQRLAKDCRDGIHLEFVGCRPGASSGIETAFFSFEESYDQYVGLLKERRWDIGLAPLRNIPWNRAKSDGKFREYTACDVCGVYSDLPPYGRVRHLETGVLLEGTKDWYPALKMLVEDEALRHQIVHRAKAELWERNRCEVVAAEWLFLLQALSNQGKNQHR